MNNFLGCTSVVLVISYKNEPKDICNQTCQLKKKKRTKRVYNKKEFN